MDALVEQLQNLPVEGLDGASVRAMQVAVDAGKSNDGAPFGGAGANE